MVAQRRGGAVRIVGRAGGDDRLVLALAPGELAAFWGLDAVALAGLPSGRLRRSSQVEPATA